MTHCVDCGRDPSEVASMRLHKGKWRCADHNGVGLPIPALPHSCSSWVIVRIGTLDAVAELYSRATVERINFQAYEALTALDYLQRLNARRAAILDHCQHMRAMEA